MDDDAVVTAAAIISEAPERDAPRPSARLLPSPSCGHLANLMRSRWLRAQALEHAIGPKRDPVEAALAQRCSSLHDQLAAAIASGDDDDDDDDDATARRLALELSASMRAHEMRVVHLEWLRHHLAALEEGWLREASKAVERENPGCAVAGLLRAATPEALLR